MVEDHFSKQAHLYAQHRPVYSRALFEYLASITPDRKMAWDCGTGNGQAACGLAEYFEIVWATDASEEQISHATPSARVIYRVAPSETSSLPEDSCDLVTVAQALHWFDLKQFYNEVQRVLKPGGILAAWCYEGTKISRAIDPILHWFYNEVVGPYWPPKRKLVEDHYRTIPFPFRELKPPVFAMDVEWTLDDLLGYVYSWSSTQIYREEHDQDPVLLLTGPLEQAWGERQARRLVRWQLAFRIGLVEK